MNQISKEALEFLEEAKKGFIENTELTTYRDTEEEFIALRGGFREDCILIYELGDPVGNFTEQLPKQQKVFVDFDEIETYKKLKVQLQTLPMLIKGLEEIVQNSDLSDFAEYKKGLLTALIAIQQTLEKTN